MLRNKRLLLIAVYLGVALHLLTICMTVRIFTGSATDAKTACNSFLANTVRSEDVEVSTFREQLNAK